MLTVPLKTIPGLAADLAPLLADKVVIDTSNAYEKRDGASANEASNHPGDPRAGRPVSLRTPAGSKGSTPSTSRRSKAKRIARAIASAFPLPSDDPDAMQLVAGLVRDAGFDPVIVGPLARGQGVRANACTRRAVGMGGRLVIRTTKGW